MSGTAVQGARYVRKRGTAEIFAYSDKLMTRGDMLYYDGPIPVPKDYAIPQAELDMIEAVRQAREGKMDPQRRSAVTTYLRKIGTREVFASSPSLMTRVDMIPYGGIIPVPEEFVVPPEEIETLVFQGKMKRPAEVPFEAVPILGKETTTERPGGDEKIGQIIEVIRRLAPEEYRKDGKPNAAIIRDRLGGVMVTKEERDEAWEKMKAEEKDDSTGHSE